MKTKENFIITFNITGACEIDVEKVISKWTYLWHISEWRNEESQWRLIKFIRKDSPNTDLKITISEKQAKELIQKLNLISTNELFKSAFSWRRQTDIDYLYKL